MDLILGFLREVQIFLNGLVAMFLAALLFTFPITLLEAAWNRFQAWRDAREWRLFWQEEERKKRVQ